MMTGDHSDADAGRQRPAGGAPPGEEMPRAEQHEHTVGGAHQAGDDRQPSADAYGERQRSAGAYGRTQSPPRYGQQPAQGWHPAPTVSPQDARQWGMFAHLSALVLLLGVPSFIGPLIIWLVRKDQDAYAAEHAKEALNFNLSVLIYVVAAGILAVPLGLVTFGLGLALVPVAVVIAGIAWFALTVVAAVKASNGEGYRYPLTIRMVS